MIEFTNMKTNNIKEKKSPFASFGLIRNIRGFTLIEIMVAVSVFVLVMVISSGAIISIFNANQKSKTLRSVMDNLNLTMESMTRTIRFGTNYHCGATTPPPTTSPLDCGSPGSSTLTVRAVDGTQVTYSLSGGRIIRTISGVNYFMTSPDVTISKLAFRVYGSPPYPDLFQPQVIIVVAGSVGPSNKPLSQSTFNLQTTISQRVFDFQ